MFGGAASNADLVAKDLAQAGVTIEAKTAVLTRHHRQLLVTAIQSRITKRTGALAGSYHVDDQGVSTEHPGAHRHEVGFHARDSLGRLYNDPPHPAAGPAADAVEHVFVEAAEALVSSL